MIFVIPLLGWIIGFLLALFFAIPLHYFWNWLGPIYFGFIPDTYQNLPFWHVVGLVCLIWMLKSLLVPKFTYPATYNK